MKKQKRRQPKTATSMAVKWLWTLSILVAVVGVFWLPWSLGSSTPVPGESYAFGFNNRAGILAFGFAILLGTAARYFSHSRPAAYNWLAANPRFFPPWNEGRAEYVILISFSVVMSAVILFWSSYLVDPAWCEARGFLYGIDLLALGQVPYTDFMYNYGPATIYLPFWLSKVSGSLLSFEQSYALVLVLFTAGGFVSLFLFLRSLEIPKPVRPFVFGLCSLVWTCLTMGLQYSPLRFLIVPVALVFLDFVATRQGGTRIRSGLQIGLGAAMAVAASLAISPEMGIATALAVLAYGFILMLRASIVEAVACLVGAVVVFAATLFAFHGYLDSVFAFGAGGGNFPIYPDLHNICLVLASLIVLPALIASALINPSEKKAPLALALAVGGGMLLPVAFASCDPGHVIINSVIPAIMMFPAAAAAGKVAFRIWTSVFAVLSVILFQVSYWNVYSSNYTFGIKSHEYYKTHPDLVATWKTKWDTLRNSVPGGAALHWSKILPFPEELEQLTSKGRVLLTGGSEGNLSLARFLLLQREPPREYFHAYSQGAATPAQIDRKVTEDRAYEYLIVPGSPGGLLPNAFLSKLFLFPVNSEVKNPPCLPDVDYVKHMLAYYEILGRYGSYVILHEKAAPVSAIP